MFSIQRYDYSSEEEEKQKELEKGSEVEEQVNQKLSISEQLKLKRQKLVKRFKLDTPTSSSSDEVLEPKLKKSLIEEEVESVASPVNSLPYEPEEIFQPQVEIKTKPKVESKDIEIELELELEPKGLVQEEGGYLPVFENFNEQVDEESSKKVIKSQVGLPSWLLNPTLVEVTQAVDLETTPLLNSHLKTRCKSLGFHQLFSVQEAVLKEILEQVENRSRGLKRDILVAAPTGSGKTLAYLLPLVQQLMGRRVKRLRGLIILPTRDLCQQVFETCLKLTSGTDLEVGLACAKVSFSEEQKLLVEQLDLDLSGGSSKLDILICTPGRLVDHLTQTKNFKLTHLQFLVIDEADRLLNEKTFNWLHQLTLAFQSKPTTQQPTLDNLKLTDRLTHDAVPNLKLTQDVRFELPKPTLDRVQLLFSATLTRNPEKLAQLHLNHPKLFTIRQLDGEWDEGTKYVIPIGLTEQYTVVNPSLKAVYLILLLVKFQIKSVIVFCNSISTANNLTKFLTKFQHQLKLANQEDSKDLEQGDANLVDQIDEFEVNSTQEIESNPTSASVSASSPLDLQSIQAFFDDFTIGNFSSQLDRKARTQLLKKFGQNQLHLLVATDLAARGIDQDCTYVINYDTPAHPKNYVHRIGRTARANKLGTAISLLEPQQVKPFQTNIIHKGGSRKVDKVGFAKEDLNRVVPIYKKTMLGIHKLNSKKRNLAEE